jgi:hypothetical protein
MQKAMLARPVPGLAAFLQAHFRASLQIVLQKLRPISSANDQHRLKKTKILTTIDANRDEHLFTAI